MEAAATALSLAATAATTFVAVTSPPSLSSSPGTSASPLPTTYMLYYHGAAPPGQDPNEDDGECKLLGPFSLLVQVALGALALLSLVYKRWRERPQRPLKVWAFDASKQVFGSGMLHLANLLMSMFSAGEFEIRNMYKPNPCSFYLLNLGIDVSDAKPVLLSPPRKSLTYIFLGTDNPRRPNPDPDPPNSKLPSLLHAPRQPTRIHRIRKLRPPTPSPMVAQAINDILHQPPWHESLRLLPDRGIPFHRQSR